MSGAFHKFSGVSNNNPIDVKAGGMINVRGEPCLYDDHYTEENGFRSTKTGACAKCVELLSNGKGIDLALERFKPDVHRRVLNFWSKVDITTWDDCWKFRNKKSKSQLLHFWKRSGLKCGYSFHPIRIAIWLSWGDFGNSGTISKCGERRCCNPLHNLPKEYAVGSLPNTSDAQLCEQLELLKTAVSVYLTSFTKRERMLDENPDDIARLNRQLMEQALLDEMNQKESSKPLLHPMHKVIDQTFNQLHKGNHISQRL